MEIRSAGKDYAKLGVLKGSALGILTAMDVSTSGLVAACGRSGDVGVSVQW